ncbi:class I tRNA ligase family protein, partial [Patescibacteria group bacterium]|nr:class I tRNA ligase family protein [Patescibacteria group bacterium]
LLSPFAPHLAEELWHQINPKLSEKKSIFQTSWPEFDPKLVKRQEIELVIQINGRVRDKIITAANISQSQAEKLAQTQVKIQKYIKGKNIIKIIFIKGKLINFVLGS